MSERSLTALIFYITVFTTGAVVLVLEVLAVRLLSPYFGTSMFVLSSVLTVILAALSLGYFYGGRLADRFPFHQPLYFIIGISGLILLALYAFAKSFLSQEENLLPLTYGPLVFASLFFFLPAFLLGMDSPYVIKLLSRFGNQGEDAGKLAGTTFFWSTVGSICGSLATGFYFIPFVGVENTMIIAAITLSLLSVGASYLLNTGSADSGINLPFWFKLPILIALALCTIILALNISKQDTKISSAFSDAEVLYETDGYYGHIAVLKSYDYIKNQETRLLKREVNSESAVYVDSYEHVFDYTKFADLYPVLRNASTTSFLMLGGGAYTIPRVLEHNDKNINIDVVELEPKLYPLALEYFGLPESPRITNHQMDARAYLESTDKQYDVIFIDVFSSGLFMPAHLSTEEFFQLVRSRLSDDGLLVINFIGARNNPGQNLSDSFYLTVESVFPNLQAFSLNKSFPKIRQNIIYLAKNTDSEFPLNDASIITKSGKEEFLSDLEIEMNTGSPKEQIIFTDDKVPVEYLVAKQMWLIEKGE